MDKVSKSAPLRRFSLAENGGCGACSGGFIAPTLPDRLLRPIARDLSDGRFGFTTVYPDDAHGGAARDCGFGAILLDPDGNQWPPPPNAAEFREVMQSRYPGRRYKFTTNQTFDVSAHGFMEGSVRSVTEVNITVMVVDAVHPEGIEGEYFEVARLEVHRQSSTNPFGWAPYSNNAISFQVKTGIIGAGQVPFTTTFCNLDVPADYLFRIVPAEGISDFVFHAAASYNGYTI